MSDAAGRRPIDPEDPQRRAVAVTRKGLHHYVATSRATGASIEFGRGDGLLTPVELLLAAIAGCTGYDLDGPATRRSEPKTFEADVDARALKDDAGAQHLEDITVTWRLRYPDSDGGRQAQQMIPRLLRQSHDRLCTVSITIERGTPITNILE